MKKSLFLYLFVFSFLINIFLVVNDGKILKSKTDEIEQLKINKDSLNIYKNMYKEAGYFTIDENKQAQAFFDGDYKSVMQKVSQDLTTLNTQEGGNPLLPEASAGKNIIYKATVINHRWMVAGYKSEYESGEILIEYFYSPNEFTTFNVIKQLGY